MLECSASAAKDSHAVYACQRCRRLPPHLEFNGHETSGPRAGLCAPQGWTVDDSCIFVDDGISGAEFAARPGFVRLMNALTPRPAFQVLIMSEESRLARRIYAAGQRWARYGVVRCTGGRPTASTETSGRRRPTSGDWKPARQQVQADPATAHGGEAVTLVQASKEAAREALARDLLTLERPRPVSADGARLRGELRVKLADWRAMLRAHVPQARRGPPALRASWVPSFRV